MALSTEPAPSALFRALRSVHVDPDLAYEAVEESRRQAGQNVIAAIGSQIAELKAEIETQGARFEAQITELRAEIETQGARIEGQGTRLEAQISEVRSEVKVLHRVIWPLIAILATSVFGLLYKAVTSPPG